jgi:hypothetical protein
LIACGRWHRLWSLAPARRWWATCRAGPSCCERRGPSREFSAQPPWTNPSLADLHLLQAPASLYLSALVARDMEVGFAGASQEAGRGGTSPLHRFPPSQTAGLEIRFGNFRASPLLMQPADAGSIICLWSWSLAACFRFDSQGEFVIFILLCHLRYHGAIAAVVSCADLAIHRTAMVASFSNSAAKLVRRSCWGEVCTISLLLRSPILICCCCLWFGGVFEVKPSRLPPGEVRVGET